MARGRGARSDPGPGNALRLAPSRKTIRTPLSICRIGRQFLPPSDQALGNNSIPKHRQRHDGPANQLGSNKEEYQNPFRFPLRATPIASLASPGAL
jgi:hypothetical protein